MAKKSNVKLIWKGESAAKQIESQSYEKLEALGEDIVTAIKDFLSQLGTGRMYKVGKTRWHQASAPGFPPAVRTGELKGSVSHVIAKERGMVYLYVGTTKDYGIYLEFGTKNMQARPWFRVILVKLKPDIIKHIVSDWRMI